MTVTEKLAALRQNMEARGLEGCVVVTDDFHGSEYVGAHFKAREFLSGFTGSAGTLAVLREGAYLWTDGRYFLQAERQLEGSGIQLMRAGQPGVPMLSQFLAEQLPESGALGFDGRTVSTRLHRTLEKALADKHIRLDGGFDPAAGVWADRPDLSTAPVWAFDSGVTRREKLTALRQDMAAQKAEWLLLTDLTDVAWALELRGGDVACTPVFLGFLLVGTDSAALYAQAESFAPEIRAALAADSVALRRAAGAAGGRAGAGGQRHGQQPYRGMSGPHGVDGHAQPRCPPQGGEGRERTDGFPAGALAGRRGAVPLPV